jgi:transaldolase / glucose-6-phosphate isomerase
MNLPQTAFEAEFPTFHPLNPMKIDLPIGLEPLVEDVIEAWKAEDLVRRLWQGGARLWNTGTNRGESEWLGWLHVIDQQLARLPELEDFSAEVYNRGFLHTVLLGMGGSSLCPEVLELTFRPGAGYPRLHVLDSTHPDQIRALEKQLDFERTLFIVSSKSGTTLEPNLFRDYFYTKLREQIGGDRAAQSFVAVTDPGSELEKYALKEGFLHVFHGDPRIGGRYSALSAFGMVPAAALGMDLKRFLTEARAMAVSCGPDAPPIGNPGLTLGAVLGSLALEGRDKVTLLSSPEISDIGAWLEQLLAESTGKNGKGLIPVSLEAIGTPENYGSDRQFHYLRLEGGSNSELDKRTERLIQAGQPVMRVDIPKGAYSIGQEFFRWEFATAVAGSILGINPFDQPDVEAAKVEARKLTSEYEKTGHLPQTPAFFVDGGLSFFCDPRNSATLLKATGKALSAESLLKAHFARLGAGDYFALLAFIDMNRENEERLEGMRLRVRDAHRVATCVGFGPRFLHSTGQAYKGGPDSGVFLQLTARSPEDLAIPTHPYGFDVVLQAQALGDFEVLSNRGRRLLRIDLGTRPREGLTRLAHIFEENFQERSPL